MSESDDSADLISTLLLSKSHVHFLKGLEYPLYSLPTFPYLVSYPYLLGLLTSTHSLIHSVTHLGILFIEISVSVSEC